MDFVFIITSFMLVALGATIAIAFSLRNQRDAAIKEVETLTRQLMDIEKEMEQKEKNRGTQKDRETRIQEEGKTRIQEDLSGMSDEELFQFITKVIKEEELYRWPDFNRSAVMHHFSLSAARVGAAFAQGGGQSLPEYVRNCRLEHACRLMVERPTMSFVEVGNTSGYQRTTTFYHDFKARFGMTPAEYRELKGKR